MVITVEKDMVPAELANTRIAASLGVGPRILKVGRSKKGKGFQTVALERNGFDLQKLFDGNISLRSNAHFISEVYRQIGCLTAKLLQNGFIHRDLRTDNIVVSQDGTKIKVLLIDFNNLYKTKNPDVYANRISYIDETPGSWFERMYLPFDWPLPEGVKVLARVSFKQGFFSLYKIAKRKTIVLQRFAAQVRELLTQKRLPIVAITGPPGSGSTTLGKQLAKEFGYKYMSVSMLFRKRVDEIIRDSRLKGNPIPIKRYDEILLRVIRNVKSHYKVDALVFGEAGIGGIIVEGRLAAWVLGPAADVGIYVTAKREARVKRLIKRGAEGLSAEERAGLSIKELQTAIRERAEKDADRSLTDAKVYEKIYPELPYVYPSKKRTGETQMPYDFIIDNTDMSVEDEIQLVMKYFGDILIKPPL